MSQSRREQDVACSRKKLASRCLLGLLLGEHLLVELQLLALEDVSIAAARLQNKKKETSKKHYEIAVNLGVHVVRDKRLEQNVCAHLTCPPEVWAKLKTQP